MDAVKPLTRQPAPALAAPTVGGAPWTLADQAPGAFTFISFYRGKHCPICRTYLQSVQAALPELSARGVDAIAVSMDGIERAQATVEEWGLDQLTIAYALDVDTAAAWGLRFSGARDGSAEPAVFSEPGHFLIKPDGDVFFAAVQSAPFTRPAMSELLRAIDFVVPNDYPARGELSLEEARRRLTT